jgi:hypothetical protein
MATYVNDLRLTELATGEGSGTWGTTTNTSLELIGEALGYATQQAFGSDADATTTVADGASDPARAMYYKITSAASLTATRTLTIAPNTISRVMFIENATSGSQSIAISQGSGASVTIATGKTAVVYLDGAGATAAVVDAMAGVDPGVTDTLTEVLVAGNTSGGTNIELSTTDKVQFRDADIYLNSSVDGQLDIVADTEIQIAATTVDLNGNLDVSGTTVSAGKITADAGIDIDNINIDGTTIALSSGDLTLDVAGDIVLDAGGSEIRLSKAGTEFGKFATDIGTPLQFAISSSVLDGDIKLQGNDGGITITALTLDMSEAGAATFNAGATFGSGIDVTGTVTADGLTVDTDTLVVDATNNRVGIGTSSPDYTLDLGGATPVIRIGDAGSIQPTLTRNNSTGGLTYNTTGQSITSLIEFKDNGAERMRIDASGLVGIGTDSPASYYAAPLVVATSGVQGGITIANTTANKQGMLAFADGTAGSDRYSGYIDYNHSSNAMSFGTNGGSEKMRIDASGNLLVGQNSSAVPGSGNTVTGISIAGQYDAITISRADAQGLIVNRNTSDGNLVDFNKDGSTVGSIGTDSSRFKVKSNSLALYLENEGNKQLVWGNVSSVPYFYPQSDNDTNLGYPTQRFKDLYLSGGVVFGTTGGSVSSKTLEDYEEGTFTPTISGSTTAGVFTYGVREGKYTKVGDLVSINIAMQVTATATSPVGNVLLTGLPFSAGAQFPSFTIGWSQYITFADQLGAYGGGAQITLRNMLNGGSGANLDGSALGSTFYIFISGTYHI